MNNISDIKIIMALTPAVSEQEFSEIDNGAKMYEPTG